MSSFKARLYIHVINTGSQLFSTHVQWHRQDFVTGGGEVRYGSIGGLEYEVPQKLTHLLQCIVNL